MPNFLDIEQSGTTDKSHYGSTLSLLAIIKPSRQLFKSRITEDTVPQLFCQLDVLRKTDEEYSYWKEKARWVRFEEIAENVLGRWSKPHVATLMQTALLDLKKYLTSDTSVVILNLTVSDFSNLAQAIAQALVDNQYLDDLTKAQKLTWILGLPHFHHHEKRSVTKTASSVSLSRTGLQPTNSITMTNLVGRDDDLSESILALSAPRLLSKKPSTNDITSEIDDQSIQTDHTKEYNVKLQRKLDLKSEGASILICPVNFVTEATIVFVRLENAIELPGLLELKLHSRFVVLLIGPEEIEKQILQVGRSMATVLTDDICREFAYLSKDPDEIVQMLDRFMNDAYVIPPSEWDPAIRIEPPDQYMSKEQRQAPEDKGEDIEVLDLTPHTDPNLTASKRPFHGLIMDLRNKLPYYVSDFTDCASLQCLATTLYLYLVCLCSVVAFGGMLGTATDNYMATMECILAASICGVIFALFSGQPLNILSATGPMLILERILKNLCSFLVRYITRFTEDCFASLVAIIFIMDAIRETMNIKKDYPVNYWPDILVDHTCSCVFSNITTLSTTNDTVYHLFVNTNSTVLNKTTQILCKKLGGVLTGSGCSTPFYHSDIFFFSCLLFIFTFFICMVLKEFRDSQFLPTKIRTSISDFAVLITIIAMSGWDAYLGLATPKLLLPNEFKPTRPHDRGWFVPFYSGKNSVWTIPVAILPALIGTILIFMDQQITAVIINRKEFKLKKKSGYHLDMFILSLTILFSSLLGLPWFVAATVLALSHVNALKLMSENTAPGEKPKFEGILEQRVSSLLMAILTGLSVFFTKILRFIPMPVLYGVFMFMGVSALRGMQIFDRVLLIFMPSKYQPDHPYLRHVTIMRVHLFTGIQILALAGMFVVKSVKLIAIGFPLLVLATCFIRKLMDKIFTQEELYWLDDILPGKDLGVVRRMSATRNVHISKDDVEYDQKEGITPPPDMYSSEEILDYPSASFRNLHSIQEVTYFQKDKISLNKNIR
ncbi:unnamed protein product [Didymodactylos carnosus]|uniref:Anion exchange protein n=2 Tax=Didymodactylos carnosus TaxID=1234261 RepID=A0A814BV87_9BILA|nr:unnamed protein product [Didymodactylos carnosus]CAF3712055.1 unnamed protein product [Didymodactylos carnosus]